MALATNMPIIIPENFVKQQFLPDNMKDTVYYNPTENGYEKEIKKRQEKRKEAF